MPGYANYDDLINESTTNSKQYRWDFFKVGPAMQGAGFWHSLWTAVGTPGAGANPAGTPGAAHTNLAGSMNFANQSPDIKTLLTMGGVANNNCTLMLYDRLVGVGAISLTSTGSKTVSSAALPRYTSGTGVQAWLEITTASTTTQPVVHLLSYTGDVNGAGQAGGSFTLPAAATVLGTLCGPLPLAVGDKGIVAISTLNVDTATTAGIANMVLLRPLAYLPLIANIWNERDFVMQLPSLPTVYDGASLGIALLATAVTATNVWGYVSLGYG